MGKVIKHSKKVGSPPGSLIYTGVKKVEEVKVSLVDYGQTKFQERKISNIGECFPFKETSTVVWINVVGLHKIDIIEELGKHFEVHPLFLEDILNVWQRPKIECFEEYIFTVSKMLTYNRETENVEAEQVNMVLGKNFFTFQEKERDVFDTIREHIKSPNSRIRRMGADYLMYALIVAIVDNYFVVLEKVGDKVETIEEELVSNPSTTTLQEIHNIKRELITLRKSSWPLREVIEELEIAESALIQESSIIYFRDVYDHIIQVIDTIETFRDMISGMLDIYLSSVSNKMNGIMKVLTIIATIFMPLTLITGIYGMNFKSMPELGWEWGYPVTLISMLVIGICMLLYFRRKKWL